MMKDAEKKTGAAPPPEPPPFTAAGALLQEIQDLNAGNPALAVISLPSVNVPARSPAVADGAA